MTASEGRDAVNGAALVIAALYFYRKLIEPAVSPGVKQRAQPTSIPAAAGQVVGIGPLASTGRFIVGFGFTFLVLSLMEGASPNLAGSFALLIALGAILGNGLEVSKDLKTQLNEKQRTLAKVGAAVEPQTPTVEVAAWRMAPRVKSVTA